MAKNSTDRESRARLRTYQARTQVHTEQVARRRRDNVWSSIALVVVFAIAIGAQLAYFGSGPGAPVASPSPSATQAGAVPDPALAEGRVWTGTALFNDVPVGFTLDGAVAPQAVASTINLVNTGFYEQNSCHRITTSGIYVLQCGDPNGDGTGGPGYSYGPVENAPSNAFYPAGTIAMARQSGNGSSQGSQFFIVYQDSTIPADAAGGYTVIGHVTSGLEQLTQLITATGVEGGASDGKPASPIVLSALTVQ